MNTYKRGISYRIKSTVLFRIEVALKKIKYHSLIVCKQHLSLLLIHAKKKSSKMAFSGALQPRLAIPQIPIIWLC